MPISWWVQRQVNDGRDDLDFSTWDRRQEADDLAESVMEGEMPPRYYKQRSRMSGEDLTEFMRGLKVTFPDGEDGAQTSEDGKWEYCGGESEVDD